MTKISCKTMFTTNYNFKVIRDGNVIQEENTHNVILERALTKRYAYHPSYSCYAFGWTIVVGSGTGTPSATDTALFKKLWEISRTSLDLIEIDDTHNKVTARYVFTIPATSAYVGTITECGLQGYFSNSMMYTHALVRDAEGNPISINKTDLDKVIITVDLTLSIGVNDPDIKMIPISKTPFRYALADYATGDKYSNFHFFNCVCYETTFEKGIDLVELIQSPETVLRRGVAIQRSNYGLSGVYAHGLPKINNKTIIAADNVRQCVGRIAQNAYPENCVCYVKAILLLGTFLIKLPNATYFPAYPLNNISVGVASEGMTEILCPLDHFVKDTDIIYKNGVPLTRNVDYTIDSDNNHRGLVELTAANDAIITGGLTTPIQDGYSEIFRVKSSAAYTGFITPYIIYAFSTDAPLFFDMQQIVPLNFLRVPIGQNFKYTLYYSEDGVSYELHATHTFVAGEDYTFEFPIVTARYFKLEVTNANGSTATSSGSGSYTSAANPDRFFALGYKTDGMIKFTSPLAEGDIITMDCMMDLPYKTDNNVIDYDFSISL